jgi:hypothetical protein
MHVYEKPDGIPAWLLGFIDLRELLCYNQQIRSAVDAATLLHTYLEGAEREHFVVIALGLDHGVGHFRPLSITRQRHLLVYHYIAMSHEGLCQVF